MENFVENIAIVPFFIPEIGNVYFVGHFDENDIVLDETDDDFAFRHNVLNEGMEVCFSQEEVISWFEKNEYPNGVKFFCEFCNVFWNPKFGMEDCEYVCIFDHTKILDHLYPKV